MTLSKKDIILYSFSAVFFVFIIYILVGSFNKNRNLIKNIEYTNAVIIDRFFTVRYTDYFSYEFSVNNKLYNGTGWHYPDNDTLSVGDSILIIYDRSNPENNKTYRDYK